MASSGRPLASQSGSVRWKVSSDVQGVWSYPGALDYSCMFGEDHDSREIMRRPRLCGSDDEESMDWLPCLMQLTRRPAALKYTGICRMLPQEVQVLLDSCSYQAKKETLRILAQLSEESSFSKAVEAARSVILHGARDADSVPEMPSVKPNLSSCDHMLMAKLQWA